MTEALPTLEEVRVQLKIPDTALTEVDLAREWGAALGKVSTTCRVPRNEDGTPADDGWPEELILAMIRRVQRGIAAKGLPLGYLDVAGEYGPARIPAYDTMIEELEGHYRKVVFG